MRSHEIEFGGRVIRYFDAYESDYLATFAEAHRAGRLCVAVGPTGYGKTTFFEFACASCFSSPVLHVMAYTRRYGFADAGEHVDRVLDIATSLRPGEYLSVAFYPKSAEVAQASSGDTWPQTMTTIEQVLRGLKERGLLPRLAGLELSVESESVDIYTDIRSLAHKHGWCLFEFGEWSGAMHHAYVGFLWGTRGKSAL